MPNPAYLDKLPQELLPQDLDELRQAIAEFRLGALRPWTNRLLKRLTPMRAVEALRQTPEDLWPHLARHIVLSGELYDDGKKGTRITSLGQLVEVMTVEERVQALDECDRKKLGLVGNVTEFMASFCPAQISALLPAIERNAGRSNYGVVQALLKAKLPECDAAAGRVAQRIKERFTRFLVFKALHEAFPERYFDECLKAALKSIDGPDDENNHHVAAEWLCLHAGAAGIGKVVDYLETRDTMWLHSVAHFSSQALGDRAKPILEAARKAGIELK